MKLNAVLIIDVDVLALRDGEHGVVLQEPKSLSQQLPKYEENART